jgi:hypothetical protein
MPNNIQSGGSTGVKPDQLLPDMEALMKSGINLILNSVELIAELVELPMDMDVAYKEPAAQLLKS